MKRFVMNIPDQLHTRLKVLCALQGTDMSDVVRRLIEDYIVKEEKRKLIVLPKLKK